jgi:pimeloyl-ACP methyl ester carboxylesterase
MSSGSGTARSSIRRIGHGSAHYAFLHGSPGDSTVWELIAELHTPGATCWLLDLPDHGVAPDLNDDPRSLESNITGSIRGLRQRVTLVGHAFGAYLAARIARRLGDQVTGLVLVSGFARVTPELGASFMRHASVVAGEGERRERSAQRLAKLEQPDLAVQPYEQPARVVHGRGDPIVPYELGVELSRLGKRAVLTTLETQQHIAPATDAAQLAPLIFSDR